MERDAAVDAVSQARQGVVDAEAGRIDTPDWVRDAVFYQIFPDQFARSGRVPAPGPLEAWDAPPTLAGFKGGDLYGIAERLPYLADLGITALYLTPIFQSASNHRYHTYDYLTVDPLLGGDAALRELLDAAHARNMRVVLDGVFNHTGRGFWAFHHILETGLASPYIDWFHVDRDLLAGGAGLNAYPTRPRTPMSGEADGEGVPDEPETADPGSGADARGSYGGLAYEAWWGLPALPKINTDHAPAREHLLSVAEHWLHFGIDGWRLDVPEEIRDATFWEEFRRRCRAIRPDAYLVGEIWHEAHDWLDGRRFDAVMNYPLAEAILGFCAGSRLDRSLVEFHGEYRANVHPSDGPAFAAELERILRLYDPAVTAVQLNLLDSHDTPRFLSLAGGDGDSLRLGTLLLGTLIGAPCVYYGDEVGLEGGMDPDCRRAFPSDAAARDESMHAFFRDVLHARAELPALRRGSARLVAARDSAVAFERRLAGPNEGRQGDLAIVAVNAGDAPTTLHVAGPEHGGRVLRARRVGDWPAPGQGDPVVGADGGLELTVGPRSGVILVSG